MRHGRSVPTIVLVIACAALGAAVHFAATRVHGPIRVAASADAAGADAATEVGILLADPLDTASIPRPPEGIGRSDGIPAIEAGLPGSREKWERVKEVLRSHAEQGDLDDGGLRVFHYLCRVLEDSSCAD
jgi:hypothetical protein